MVATSVRGKNRSFTRRLIALTSASDANCPLTRTLMRSGPAWNKPDGVTAFWACKELMMERVSSPSAASFRVENSRKMISSCAPRMSTLPTLGTVSTFARIFLDSIAQLTMAQAVAGESIDVAEDIAEAIVKARTDHPCGKSALMSAIMLRTRAQVGATSAALVLSRRYTKTVVWPDTVTLFAYRATPALRASSRSCP